MTGCRKEIITLISDVEEDLGLDYRFSYREIHEREGGEIDVELSSREVAEELVRDLILRGYSEIFSARNRWKLVNGANINITVLDPDERILQIVTSVACVRREPSHTGELLTQMIMGESARLIKSQTGWYLICLGDKYLGWIDSSYVQEKTSGEIEQFRNDVNMIIKESVESVWIEPNERSNPVISLVSGTGVVACGCEGKYMHVRLADGREGYIRCGALENPHVGRFERDRLIARAKRHLGVPYLWGGTTGRGFDCSGFVMRMYSLEGISLPRDSDLQSRRGSFIPPEEIMEASGGDLLFFGGNDVVNHVAILIEGGKFIHASGEVKIGSLERGNPVYDDDLAGSLLFGRDMFV